MGYKRPEEVVSPKDRWRHKVTLCDTGQDGFSVVEGIWDGAPCVAMRWNGDDLSGGSGAPQSTGWPTWFIVPSELEDAIRMVGADLGSTIKSIRCTLTQPKDFEWGVFQVEVEIVDTELLAGLANKNVLFQLPKLSARFFRELDEHENKYFAPPVSMGAEWQGRIVDGKWMGIVQSNGVPEDQNETTRLMVRDALIRQVAKALRLYTALPLR
ncbi:hypothetical protein [Cellvibrio sp. UBA7671]|uniref:hypothetical protein n=1 Tax=Cellvibrio sp. UBA7671 TaxID=1946312 RepID=UPI002F35C61A